MESRTKDIEMLDTCVVLRAMLGDVAEQSKKAIKLLNREGVRYYISDMMVFEAVFVMEKKMIIPRERIAWLVINFLSLGCVCNGTGIFDGVFKLYLEHPKLSFADCYLAVQAGGQGTTPLWTFDRKLAAQTEEAKLV